MFSGGQDAALGARWFLKLSAQEELGHVRSGYF